MRTARLIETHGTDHAGEASPARRKRRGAKSPYQAPMIDKLRRAQAAQPELAPEGEQEFLDWLNAKK